ncbi:MAG TPA: hypothetical protein VM841_00710 [Actinomycetota bacterium]|nr:hypothetical protein [Actinomycetota bacterium]
MTRRAWIVGLLAALAAALPAAASHNADDHSDNMSLVANWDHDGTYRQGSDIAFWGDTMVLGNFDNPGGFRVIDIANPAKPKLLGHFKCPGPQSEVAIWRDLVFVGVDNGRAGESCDEAGQSSAAARLTGDSWEGIRVVSIADPAKPKQLAAVHTDCGAHTLTLIPDTAKDRVILYANSYPAGRQGAGCNAHFKISVVEVSLSKPQDAKVIATPSVGTAVGCHDITVHMERKLAAAACLTETQIWDITDPVAPATLGTIRNASMNIQHSTAWSNDGKKLVIGDEMGAAAAATGCMAEGHLPLGALWFYDIAEPSSPQMRSSLVIPRREVSIFCTAHNFAPVPMIEGRDILVSGWYNGGTTVLDFTDPSNVEEIGHYTPRTGPKPASWASYWYRGHIYVNNFDEGFIYEAGRSRGLDVLKMSDPRVAKALTLTHLNPQTQEALRAAAPAPEPKPKPVKVLPVKQTRAPLPATGVGAAPSAALLLALAVAAAATLAKPRTR